VCVRVCVCVCVFVCVCVCILSFSHLLLNQKKQNICNEIIKKQLSVYTKNVNLTKAKQIKGIRAVFGEAYPDPVNVVCVGVPIDDL
jgi:hypothetical protein